MSKASGFCTLSSECSNELDDIDHILRSCNALAPTRFKLREFTQCTILHLPDDIKATVLSLTNPSMPSFVQFILDCSVIPAVISSSAGNESVGQTDSNFMQRRLDVAKFLSLLGIDL